MRSRSGISVMFMTFIAVCILSMIFLAYYLHLTQQSLSASEAQRIYAEAAQENLDAFYYPPGSDAASQGAPQMLVIHNRGIGAVIKYIFIKHDQSLGGPINGGDIVLRSGESIRLQPAQPIPDGTELLIVTERGSTFTARQGYFNVSLSPAELILYLGASEAESGVSTLIITSNNYEGRLVVKDWTDPPACPQVGYEIIGERQFNLTRNGLHALTIRVDAREAGKCRLLMNAIDLDNDRYSKVAELAIEVRKREITPTPPTSSYVTLTIQKKSINVPRGGRDETSFVVEGHNGYAGTLEIPRFLRDWYCYRVTGAGYTSIECSQIFASYLVDPTSITLDPRVRTSVVGRFSFTISNTISPGIYEIWMHAYGSEPSRILRAGDYFTLIIT